MLQTLSSILRHLGLHKHARHSLLEQPLPVLLFQDLAAVGFLVFHDVIAAAGAVESTHDVLKMAGGTGALTFLVARSHRHVRRHLYQRSSLPPAAYSRAGAGFSEIAGWQRWERQG